MIRILTLLLTLLPLYGVAQEFSSCSDPRYIDYVSKRNQHLNHLPHKRYHEQRLDLSSEAWSSLSDTDKHRYLYVNTVESARFDDESVALHLISLYEKRIPSRYFLFEDNQDAKHKVAIAKAWLAYNKGDFVEVKKHLLASADVNGSPVLSSFGPYKDLIRQLYIDGHKALVLAYLAKIEDFWNDDSALQFLEIWKVMIEHDCPLQFMFYDKTSFPYLNLSDNA